MRKLIIAILCFLPALAFGQSPSVAASYLTLKAAGNIVAVERKVADADVVTVTFQRFDSITGKKTAAEGYMIGISQVEAARAEAAAELKRLDTVLADFRAVNHTPPPEPEGGQ